MITNKNKSQKNIYFMKLALGQAKINLGTTKDNPSVGCIIVKNDHIISSGFTSIKGRPHAEQNAINFSKTNLKNSELYVTLEPCSHYGRTPPCVTSIIKSKIKKVIFHFVNNQIRKPEIIAIIFIKKLETDCINQ